MSQVAIQGVIDAGDQLAAYVNEVLAPLYVTLLQRTGLDPNHSVTLHSLQAMLNEYWAAQHAWQRTQRGGAANAPER